jgi:hypothetical protein
MGAVAGHLPQPGKEARRVAQLPEVPPHGEEDLLRYVMARLDIAQDGERDRADQAPGGVDQVGERLAVSPGRRLDLRRERGGGVHGAHGAHDKRGHDQ